MTSPFLVGAISVSVLVALAAIMSASSSTMEGNLLAQESMKIQTQKNQEDLGLIISGGVLSIENKGLLPSTLKEIRIFEKNSTNILSKTQLNEQLEPLGIIIKTPLELSLSNFSQKKLVTITDLGNVFAAQNLDDLALAGNGTGTGDGEAMINGMGLNSRILNHDFVGKLTHGYGDSGNENSLKPYNVFSTAHDFAGQILSTDTQNSLAISQFNREYEYLPQTNSIQISGATSPNIMGYSTYRTVAGSAMPTIGTDGITISGTGVAVIQLNDLSGQNMTIEGTIPSGSRISLIEFDRYDLMTANYDVMKGFEIVALTATSTTSGSTYCWNSGYSYCHRDFSYTQTISPTILVSSISNTVIMDINTNVILTPSGIQNTNTFSINQISVGGGGTWRNGIDPPPSPPVNTNDIIKFYDKEPANNTFFRLTQDFQTLYSFVSGKQYYLVVDLSGGPVFIKAFAFNPSSTPYLKITSLPQNTPYEIIKDGKLAVSGMSDYQGTINLLINDVNIGGTSPSGTMYLYPNSLAYRGPFSTIVFDNVNGQTIHIPTVEDKVYVAHAYVNIPVTGNVVITNVYLDNTLRIPYLEGNYTTGNNIKVPVIPGYHDINMDINGVHTTTVIANVLGGTGLKVIPPSTNTITATNDNNIIPSIEATTGTATYVIPTSSGTITVSITATISGDSEIYNWAYFGATPPAPPPPPRRDPLTSWVDVYKNGVLIQSQQIYFNNLPTMDNSGGVSNNSSWVEDEYEYPQTVINGVVQTNVQSGDFVEYYVYAKIHADGSTPPVPAGHTLYRNSGYGHATAVIHSGSILSS